MAYRNIAQISDISRSIFKNQIREQREKCVFISHKKEDEQAAVDIGRFLMEVVGVNIYLDILDAPLQTATEKANDRLIVESIKKGLECSTHLLCLISDKTRLSWWVPYEIGIADDKNLNIASLKLKSIDDIPSFLKIHPAFYNVDDFIRNAVSYTPFGTIFFNENYNRISNKTEILKKYIDI
jgi:hypothetical protein